MKGGGATHETWVVMVLDTLRYDVVHHLGSTRVYIPNLDALRRDSVSFSAAFGEGEPTVPVRRALMTGVRSFPWRYPFDTQGLYTGNRGWHRIPPEQTTLAELLLARGYKTALIADVFHLFKATMNFTPRLAELGVHSRPGERQLAKWQSRSHPRRAWSLRAGDHLIYGHMSRSFSTY